MRYVAVLMKFWASLGRRRGIDRDEQALFFCLIVLRFLNNLVKAICKYKMCPGL
jgi:hypothetical protein